MNYQQTIQYLYNATPVFEHVGAKAYKEGLENTIALDEHFNHPHRQYRTIHIAGTNGKGSCSHSIAAILQEEGYKVGLYTSPHLVDFKERIRVNGQCIDEGYVVDFVRRERHFFEPLHPSFFELTTAMALKYFADQQVDIAVIEVGLGGRLDCTNIIQPELCVITNISFDHMQFLGHTLPAIAQEKAGIIKAHTPVVIGEANELTRPVFVQKATELGASIHFAEDKENREVTTAHRQTEGGIDYDSAHFGHIHGELAGEYQVANTNTILCAAHLLRQKGIIRNDDSVRAALDKVCELTGLEGRWQTIQRAPLVICDTGHNVAGWQYLSHQIGSVACRTRRMVFGMVDDKDIDHVMQLLPKDATYYFTQASSKRAFPVQTVYEKARLHGLKGSVCQDVYSAYKQALADSSEADFIFVGGSSYIVADFLTALRQENLSAKA